MGSLCTKLPTPPSGVILPEQPVETVVPPSIDLPIEQRIHVTVTNSKNDDKLETVDNSPEQPNSNALKQFTNQIIYPIVHHKAIDSKKDVTSVTTQRSVDSEIAHTDSDMTSDTIPQSVDPEVANDDDVRPAMISKSRNDEIEKTIRCLGVGDIDSVSDMSIAEATISALPATVNDHVKIIDSHPEAFNTLFLEQRQKAIANSSYRTTIQSWNPTSLRQLIDSIELLTSQKSVMDYHWIIFYWISCNIIYDTDSYFKNNIPRQEPDDVFRTKKGVCAGYSRLYKYLCDQLGMKCEEISGSAKGFGFENHKEGTLLEKNHAWNAIQIGGYWYLLDSTWGKTERKQNRWWSSDRL